MPVQANRWATKKKLIVSAVVVLILLLFVLRLGSNGLSRTGAGQDVQAITEYAMATPIDGVTLHVIHTTPENVRFRAVNDNIVKARVPGINGGFFWGDKLLSIAVEDDKPVQGSPGDYGSGWFNAKYTRGTLVYDKVKQQLSIQRAKSVEQLQVSDRARYWAQGGVSMYLQDNEAAAAALVAEVLPFAADSRLRSAIVYDETNNLYLIVSSTKCTAEQFRSAILTYGASLHLQDGIYLDGDGSSQLLIDEHELQGDGRSVVQMIELIKD